MANYFLQEKRKRLHAHTNLSFINSLTTYNEFISKKMFKIHLYNFKIPTILRNSFLKYIKNKYNFSEKLYLFFNLKYLKKLLKTYLITISLENEVNISIILKFFNNINTNNLFEKISDNILDIVKFPIISVYNTSIIKKKESLLKNNYKIYTCYKNMYILKKYINKKVNSFKYFQYIFKIFGESQKFKNIKQNKFISKSEYEFRTVLVACAIKLNIKKILEKEIYITCSLQKERKYLNRRM